jgi:hypothetical protein
MLTPEPASESALVEEGVGALVEEEAAVSGGTSATAEEGGPLEEGDASAGEGRLDGGDEARDTAANDGEIRERMHGVAPG